METLRSEIIESQKARNDLMKWKLLLVSGLGAAGLGFSEHTGKFRAELVLCCIPFVCAYVDLVCHHLSLRILVIGKFISSTSVDDKALCCIRDYEKFLDTRIRGLDNPGYGNIGAFDLENWALIGSSILLSLGLIGYPYLFGIVPKAPFIVSGTIGILTALIIRTFAGRRAKKIENSVANNTDDSNDGDADD